MQIRKAVRKKAKLRLALMAVSGAGKTYSAIQLAIGLGGKIGMIDTENGSGDLYANLTDYDIISIGAPYTVPKYLEALKAFEQAGYDTVIIDSLSHAWAGDGGLLDKQGKAAQGGNGYTAWNKITPEYNSLVTAMLSSQCHIIATVRSKQDYIQDKDSAGKTVIKKVGLAPVQRDGLEYEFTTVFEIGRDHTASASKDRTGLFDDQYFKITSDTGKILADWLNSGESTSVDAAVAESVPRTELISQHQHNEILHLLKQGGLSLAKFCKFYGIESIQNLPEGMFERAKASIISYGESRLTMTKEKQNESNS